MTRPNGAGLLFTTALAAIGLGACDGENVGPGRENAPPVPSITQPASGSTVLAGESVTFQGAAQDPEDGQLTGAQLRWSSDLDGALGTGASLTVSGLSSGLHRIVLEATDSEGLTGETSAELIVEVPPVGRLLTEADVAAGFVIGQVVIQYEEGELDDSVLREIDRVYGFLGQHHLPDLDRYIAVFEADADSTERIAEALTADPRVAIAGPEGLLRSTGTPNDWDPMVSSQYHHSLSGVDVHWDRVQGPTGLGAGATVAVIEAGFDISVGDLAAKVFVAPAYVTLGPETRMGRGEVVAPATIPGLGNVGADANEHGALVASVAVGADEGNDLVGVAPSGSLMPIRIPIWWYQAGSGITSRFTALTRAILYALENGADIINISLGHPPTARNLQMARASGLAAAIDSAVARGKVVVVAAGNCHDAGAAMRPNCFNQVWTGVNVVGQVNDAALVVGSTDAAGTQVLPDSNRGLGLDLVAPGIGICGGDTALGCRRGNSFAAPQVAGILALHFARDADDPLYDLMADLLDLGPAGWDSETGYGRAIVGIGLDSIQSAVASPGVPTSFTLRGRNFDRNATLEVDGQPVMVDPAGRSPTFDQLTFDFTMPDKDSVPVVVKHPQPSSLVSDTLWLRAARGVPVLLIRRSYSFYLRISGSGGEGGSGYSEVVNVQDSTGLSDFTMADTLSGSGSGEYGSASATAHLEFDGGLTRLPGDTLEGAYARMAGSATTEVSPEGGETWPFSQVRIDGRWKVEFEVTDRPVLATIVGIGSILGTPDMNFCDVRFGLARDGVPFWVANDRCDPGLPAPFPLDEEILLEPGRYRVEWLLSAGTDFLPDTMPFEADGVLEVTISFR